MQHIKVTSRALCSPSFSCKQNILRSGSWLWSTGSWSRQADAMRTSGWRGAGTLPSPSLPACPTAEQPLGQPRHAPSSSLQNESCQVFQGCSLFWLCSRFGWLSSCSTRCEKIKDRERRMRGEEGKYFWLQSTIKLLCQDCNLGAMIPYFIAAENVPFCFNFCKRFRKKTAYKNTSSFDWRLTLKGVAVFLSPLCSCGDSPPHCLHQQKQQRAQPGKIITKDFSDITWNMATKKQGTIFQLRLFKGWFTILLLGFGAWRCITALVW